MSLTLGAVSDDLANPRVTEAFEAVHEVFVNGRPQGVLANGEKTGETT